MKFCINQSELSNALSIVSKGISARATLPILTGVYINANQDNLVFQTTNQHLSIKYVTQALIEEEGTTVIPGKLFFDIIKNLSDASVSVSVEDTVAHISCDQARFNIKTLDPQDFPSFPEVETHQSIDIPFDKFVPMVKETMRAVSKDESRAILTGVLVSADNEQLKMVATDSYRLAVSQSIINTGEPFEAVISGAFLQDLTSLKKSDDNLSLALSDNQIVAHYQNITFINRRLEGNYPNYRQLLPDTYATRAEVPTERFIAAVKRVALLSSSTSPIKCSIDSEEGTITVSGSMQDIGSAKEEIEGKVEGESMEIAFNCGYLQEGLNAIKTDTIIVELQSPLKPGIFKSQEQQDYLYLVMPVRII